MRLPKVGQRRMIEIVVINYGNVATILMGRSDDKHNKDPNFLLFKENKVLTINKSIHI